ncbi:dipeptide epimerase [Pedobacter sp. HMF7647]|uniref:Dipeptide epimerase n=1 Tax=Hufsiella arboris TaxID=2695275 RepID=A0A7K1YC85_9SPHI|nr:dipeptide epimerase [Hufsiella arboris]MXV52193.1 dipeptide epimerase [Hufsiella arboris]
MIITKTEIYRFSIPMVPFAIATGTMSSAQNVFIRIYTDQGLYGVGECSAFPMIVGETQDTCLALAKDFAMLWKGRNALEIDERLNELNLFVAGNTTIKSAFDMALYDLAAKNAGLPLYKFLNGAKKEITTDITVGLGSPEEMASKAVEFVSQTAMILKVKLGKNPFDDIKRIERIRESIPENISIRVDANQGWSFDEAVIALQGLEKLNIEFCEQPMRAYHDRFLPDLRKKTPVKIMADESCYSHKDAERLIDTDSCDYINIKFSKSGGIHEAIKIYNTARKGNIPCMIGGMLESRIALSAKLHFAYASPELRFHDMDTCMLGHLEDPCVGGVKFNGYKLSIDDLPGIAADADNTFLDKCKKWVI